MNVLISSVSRKVSLVRSFKAAGWDTVVVADMDQNCAGMYEGDESVILPALDADSFRHVLLGACLRLDVSLVVPTRDEEVLAFSEWKSDFKKHGVTLLAPSKDTVSICQDKIRFTEWCQEKGFKVARVVDVNNDLLTYPLFVRARRGKGSTAARRIVDFPSLLHCIADFGSRDCIVQEYVRSPEYSIDVFATAEGEIVSVVPRQRVQIVGGESWNTVTVSDPAMQAEAVKLAKALKLTGHAVLQCFRRGDDILWIECNPRLGGASALAFEAGCASPKWLLKGVTVDAGGLVPYQVGLRMLRYTQDRFVSSPL